MGVDEVGDGIDEHHHKENCEHNRDDHDNKVVRQTNSSYYGVDMLGSLLLVAEMFVAFIGHHKTH